MNLHTQVIIASMAGPEPLFSLTTSPELPPTPSAAQIMGWLYAPGTGSFQSTVEVFPKLQSQSESVFSLCHPVIFFLECCF